MRSNFSQRFFAFLLLTTALSWSIPAAALAQSGGGIDIAGMDRSVDPGDDFFSYANGTWYKNTEIPNVASSIGIFQGIAAEVSKRNAALITEAAQSKDPDARLVADYHTAYMNEQEIETLGLAPLKTELSSIASIKDKTQLSRFLGTQLRADVDPLNNTNFYTDRLFGLFVTADFNNPKKNVPYLLQGGLGMPDRDYYLGSDQQKTEVQAKYRTHIANVLKLAAVPDAEAKAARIYDMERKIAEAHATRDESSNVPKANNPWKMADFSAKAPGLVWKDYFDAADLEGEPMVMVWHPGAITGISALANSQPIEAWQDYLTYRSLDRNSGLLPKAFADESFNFYRKELLGVRQQSPRAARAVGITSNALGDVVGKMYTDKYFPAKAKAEIQTLVKNIIAAFRLRIDKIDWMTAETKAKAKAKVDTLYVGVGYPDKWRSYSAVTISPKEALGNQQRISLANYRHALAKLNQPVDKSEWWMNAQTVNALNIPIQNAMNFPAAILLPPFFDPNADPVVNYGSIGSIIGHEISHSFDATGSLFDATGKLQNWWSPQDLQHFAEAGKALQAQYDVYEALPGLNINGKLTLDENIADLAGLAAAYDGYRAAYGGKEAPTVNGLTGDQRFFVAFAQAHRGKMREQTLRSVVMTDGHAPDRFRALTVRNMDPWYTAFDVKPGKKLYLDPKARVRVW